MCDVGKLKKSLQNMSCRPITVFLCIILQTSQVGFYARESSRKWCALISENTSHWVYVFAKSTSPSPTMTQCNYMWLCDLCFVFSLSSEQTQLVCLFYHFVLLRNKGDVSWSWLWLLCGVSHKAWSECWKRCHCSCQLCKMTSDLWISFCHFKLRMCYTSHMPLWFFLRTNYTDLIYISK